MLTRTTGWWIGAAVVGVVVTSLGVATTWSYIKTVWKGVGKTIRDVTPIAFDLERLNGMIQDLEPEIRRNQQVVAQLEVEVEYLAKEVDKMKSEQDQALAQMQKLRDALRENKSEYQFAGQIYGREQVEQDLNRRLDVYQEHQSQLEAKQQLLQERRRTLEAAIRKVQEYRRQYDQLVAKAETLRAELALLEQAQAAGDLNLDNSKLAQAKQLSQELEKRIRVMQKVVDSQRQPPGEIPVDVESRPAAERFDELFRQPESPEKTDPET